MSKATNRVRLTSTIALTGAALWMLTGCASGAGTAATALQAPNPGVAAACAELTPDSFTGADIAFRGTVTNIEGEQVTLRVDNTYQGNPGENVTVPQQPNNQASELSIGAFTEGGEYLISAQDGVILTCGASGPATTELVTIYEQAFAR